MFITLSVFSLIISFLNKSSKGTYTCTTQMGFEMQSQKVSMSLSTVKFIKFSALAGILFSLLQKANVFITSSYFHFSVFSMLIYFIPWQIFKGCIFAPLRKGFEMQSQKVSMPLSTVKFIKFSALAGILFSSLQKANAFITPSYFHFSVFSMLIYFIPRQILWRDVHLLHSEWGLKCNLKKCQHHLQRQNLLNSQHLLSNTFSSWSKANVFVTLRCFQFSLFYLFISLLSKSFKGADTLHCSKWDFEHI